MVNLTSKVAEFTFQVDTRNTNLSDTEARLVIEGKSGNVIHTAKIDSEGNGLIEFLPTNLKKEGTLFLEVINKDFYSKLWENKYMFESDELSTLELYYQKGLQKLKVTSVNESRKEKHINILLEHTAKRYNLGAADLIKLKNKTSNLL